MTNLDSKKLTNALGNLRELKQAKLNKLQRELGYKPYFYWVQDYWTSRGTPLDFKDRPHLKDYYKDQHPFIVTEKGAQSGATERGISEAVWLPDQFKENAIYFFPTSGSVSDLVQERIDGPINENPYLAVVSGRAKKIMGKQADKVGLKRMSKGFVYFRGAQSPAQITSVPADCIFVDEVDRIDPMNIPYLDKRLLASKRKWQRWFSTPTIPNFGIDVLFQKSDQHRYEIKCPYCNEKQVLDFFINIDKEKKILFCKKCKQQITPWRCQGEWIDKFGKYWYQDKPAEIRGFHLSQLYSPLFNVSNAINDSKKSAEWEVQQFYNQTLGLPYEPKGSKIGESEIGACIREYTIPFREKECYFGVDVGKVLHIVIRSKTKILWIGTVKDFVGEHDSLEALIREWQPMGVVIDALPETREAQNIANLFNGRVWLCYYSGLAEVKDKEWFKKDGQKINTDRTLSLDVSFAEIKEQKIEMPKNINDYVEFKEQLKSLVRVISKNDSTGKVRAEWLQQGDDHFFHAYNYSTLAKHACVFKMPELFVI